MSPSSLQHADVVHSAPEEKEEDAAGRLVEGAPGELRGELRRKNCEHGHTGFIYAVAVMPDGHRILSGACYRNPGTGLVAPIRMHRLDGTPVRTFLHHEGTATAMDLAPLPDNTHVLSASRYYTVKLFNVNDGAVLRTFNAAEPSMRNRAFMCLALLPDGLRFVSGAEDGTARIIYHGLAPA